jgi:hypothetical protein
LSVTQPNIQADEPEGLLLRTNDGEAMDKSHRL